jgi:hypothetical protein
MSGLFRRIRRTRAAAAEESRTDLPAPSEPQDATTTAERPGGQPPLGWSAQPAPAPVEEQPLAEMHDLPAGLEVEELRSPRPATERRSRLRRRTRYLRRVRELLLRDLGGLVYEIHRASGGDRAHHESLVRAKAQRLAALDAELYALEGRLGAEHPENVLREPGVGGTCPSCGELHASDARFCSACGTPLSERAAGDAEEAAPAPEEPAPSEPPAEEPATASEAPTVVQPPDEPAPADEARPAEEPRQEPETGDTRYTTNGRDGDRAAGPPDLATPSERPS